MKHQELVEAVVELIAKRGQVTIREIQDALAGRIPVQGDWRASMANLCWAVGLSAELCDVMEAVRVDGQVVPQPCSPLIYLADGCSIPTDLPVAKRVPANGYRAPHFCPVVFRLREALR